MTEQGRGTLVRTDRFWPAPLYLEPHFTATTEFQFLIGP
jgi:hypothetical protein